MKEINYEKDMYIDDSALDVECLDQPSLMMRYTAAQANAEREIDRIKEALDVLKAQVDKEIRQYPEKFDIAKITEAAVTAAINTDKKVRDKTNELIEAQYESKMLKGAVTAVSHRKDMLEALIKLHGQQYFAGPSVPRDLSKEAQKKHAQQQSNEKVTIRRRRG